VVQDALADERIIIAATGNSGCACDTIPASLPGVIAVGASDQHGNPAVFSNWGSSHRAQGILAPGFEIPGACTGSGVCRGTGTSFSTAVVSGISALLVSMQIELSRQRDRALIRRILLDSCDPCFPESVEICSACLRGRLNLNRAVAELERNSVIQLEGEMEKTEISMSTSDLAQTPTVEPIDSQSSLLSAIPMRSGTSSSGLSPSE